MKNNMRTETTSNFLACYWDFENLHASLTDLQYGERRYQNNRFAVQGVLVNINAVMSYLTGTGTVLINKAFANWQYLSRYRNILNEHGFDLIQLFPRGSNMKNSADIRLALDVLEDINRYDHLTHIVVISSDSDYISLAQKIKQSGRTIIGIGVREATSEYWVKACNEFKFYQTLLEEAGNAAISKTVNATTLIRNGEELLLRALKHLIAQKGENRVFKGHLKAVMQKMDSTFKETDYGFPTFSAYLNAFSDKVQAVDREDGGYVGLTQKIFEQEFSSNGIAASSKSILSRRDKASVEIAL